MHHLQRKVLAALPSTEEEWLCIIGRMPGWIQRSSAADPWRPPVCFIMDRRTNDMLYVGVGQRRDSLAQLVTRTLVNVMTTNFSDEIRAVASVSYKPTPAKPASIEFTHDAVHQKIKPNLDVVGIRSTCAPHIERITEIMRGMTASAGEPIRHGILSTLQGNIFAVRRYFDVTAAFHKAAPWKLVGNEHVIEVRYPPAADPFWVVIMGNGGEVFGIACYDSLDVVNRLPANETPEPLRGIDHDTFALLYGMPFEGTPFEDLDLIEQFGFPIHSYEGFPAPTHVRIRNGNIEHQQATLQEVQRILALMQVLPEFVSSQVHMAAENGYPRPAAATLPLPEDDPYGSISLKFPPDGLTFRPPMHGDEDDEQDEEDFDFDPDHPLDITPDDLMRAIETLMGMSAKGKSRQTSGGRKPAKKAAKKAAKKPTKTLPKLKKKGKARGA